MFSGAVPEQSGAALRPWSKMVFQSLMLSPLALYKPASSPALFRNRVTLRSSTVDSELTGKGLS